MMKILIPIAAALALAGCSCFTDCGSCGDCCFRDAPAAQK